ncbi:MAG: isoleucine--tRNA ligase [Pseudomonadota bacterium]
MPDASQPTAEPRDYKDTLFLPKTDFPMRGGLPKAEPKHLDRWTKMDLYRRLRETASERPLYVLHDGPPYANGHLHMGHAFNKVLKDLIVRSRQMMGFNANYVPGWDCHGLPIEWKVEEAFRGKGRKKGDVPASEFRAACRKYAQEWVDIQSKEFQRYGIEGDWKDPYLTMKFDSEAAIVAELLKFVENGLLYRGSKPVMWSPVEQTALAEAEIEYHDHQSTTIWVKFPMRGGALAGATVVIWTTTPWTIPGNRAICYGPTLSYGLYEVSAMKGDLDFEPWSKPGDRLVVADALAESVREAGLIESWSRVGDVAAKDLEGVACDHPLKGFAGGYDFAVPLLSGDHVTDEAGTGFVHTAPSHGQEDYLAWMAHGLPQEDIPYTVGPDGAYTNEAPGFEGKKVLRTDGKKAGQDGDANKSVIAALIEQGGLLARGRLTHSYPHSWRSKAPVIFRNTPQWFIRLGKPGEGGLRDKALSAIEETGFTPPSGRNRIRTMVEGRPDWLISRQRAWGVPITIFAHKETGEPLNDPSVNARIVAAVREKGADAWFDTPAQTFLGDDYAAADYDKVEDILDVWFDSGSTHAFVLEQRDDLKWPADIYLEGSDQHRGWFQSSLLEACGTRGRAPYDNILTHGFVLDAEGRKMSKSLGNVVDPAKITNQYGADILRIWVASSDYADDLRIGDESIGSAVDAYRKLRNTLRYLLGALDGFADAERVDAADMPELEHYMHHRLAQTDKLVRASYAAFDFKGAWRAVFDLCASDLSAFYLDVRKDSLYCDDSTAMRRRAARMVMADAFDCIVRWLAPVCVFTMEEAFLARYPDHEDHSVHLETFFDIPEDWHDEALGARWQVLRSVRRVITGALEGDRRDKKIGASLEASPTVYVADAALFEECQSTDFMELAITSTLTFVEGKGPAEAFTLDDTPGVAVTSIRTTAHKCARCWRYTGDVGTHDGAPELCGRCAAVPGIAPGIVSGIAEGA